MNRLLRKWLHYREMEKKKRRTSYGSLVFPIPTEEEQKAFDEFLGIKENK